MSKNSYRNKFLAAKEYYKSIGAIRCPALNNELVYFRRDGFEHLIRKDRKIRPIPDQLRRFKLLYKAGIIIVQGKIIEQEIDNGIYFWTLGYSIGSTLIKIIIWQKRTGSKKFLSVINKD
jgi:hypothetical protein